MKRGECDLWQKRVDVFERLGRSMTIKEWESAIRHLLYLLKKLHVRERSCAIATDRLLFVVSWQAARIYHRDLKPQNVVVIDADLLAISRAVVVCSAWLNVSRRS